MAVVLVLAATGASTQVAFNDAEQRTFILAAGELGQEMVPGTASGRDAYDLHPYVDNGWKVLGRRVRLEYVHRDIYYAIDLRGISGNVEFGAAVLWFDNGKWRTLNAGADLEMWWGTRGNSCNRGTEAKCQLRWRPAAGFREPVQVYLLVRASQAKNLRRLESAILTYADRGTDYR